MEPDKSLIEVKLLYHTEKTERTGNLHLLIGNRLGPIGRALHYEAYNEVSMLWTDKLVFLIPILLLTVFW